MSPGVCTRSIADPGTGSISPVRFCPGAFADSIGTDVRVMQSDYRRAQNNAVPLNLQWTTV